MAFIPWKDRVTATPHRYKLTEVAPDTYDLEAVPGAVSEAGTPVNAENLDRLIQRDGDDIKDTVVAFTEAGARANIATGESAATLFGKIKKYFTDMKTHAFTAPSTTQGTGTTSVPCDNLLTQSSFARVYRYLTEINPAYNDETPMVDVITSMADNSIAIYRIETDMPLNYPLGEGTCVIEKANINRNVARYIRKTYNATTTLEYYGSLCGTAGHANQWSGWKQVIDDSSAQTISAIKTYSVSPLVPTTPSGSSAAVAKSYVDAPTSNITLTKASPQYTLKNTDIAVGTLPTGSNKYSTLGFLDNSGNICGLIRYGYTLAGTTELNFALNSHWAPTTRKAGINLIHNKGAAEDGTQDTVMLYPYEDNTHDLGRSTYRWKDIHFSGALKKNGVEVFPSPYDKVIRTQTEFNTLIASATWLDAKSVAFVGAFTLSTANNSGVKIPATVKQIHGFNGAKITITNFLYNSSTAKGGLWYDTAPTTQDYSIRDLEVDCTGTPYSSSFYNCNNLSNCTGKGTGGEYGRGFYYCNNLSNCTGTGTGTTNGYGFTSCNNLSNCTGTGTGTTKGYGFAEINYAVNCKDGGSSTGMWTGTNKNINVETCRKTPVQVTAAELTALNT